MFRLDNYMEKWAEAYKPLSHTSKDPAFFRMNDIFTLDEFLQNYKDIDKPCCGIVTHLKANINGKKRIEYPTYECVFLIRADARDYKLQADAKHEIWEIMWAFIIKLDEDRQKALASLSNSPLARIDLSNLKADTIGPITDGWFMVTLTINSEEHNLRCYTPTDYDESKLTEWTPY